ncbi:TetR/AcrR family transcriptional regulator [Paenibacillus sp. 1P07SE]|uniref:TetR/AcrR family transcriptional regulator n=1 Tax=Paenibacillus sp. 1P07SE TaxID=3132209 RepID=UPI0039A42159
MSDRREREQLLLREKVLQAALGLAQEEGWSAVSIRRIATQIEYSTTKVYELFDNKDQLVLALLRKGFDLLARQLEEAVQEQHEAQAKAEALATAYCRFAWENSAYYRIMYGMDGVPFGVQDTWQEGMCIGEISHHVLAQLLPHVDPQELMRFVYATWGTLHGISSLYLAGRLYGGQKEAEALALQAVLSMIEPLRERE